MAGLNGQSFRERLEELAREHEELQAELRSLRSLCRCEVKRSSTSLSVGSHGHQGEPGLGLVVLSPSVTARLPSKFPDSSSEVAVRVGGSLSEAPRTDAPGPSAHRFAPVSTVQPSVSFWDPESVLPPSFSCSDREFQATAGIDMSEATALSTCEEAPHPRRIDEVIPTWFAPASARPMGPVKSTRLVHIPSERRPAQGGGGCGVLEPLGRPRLLWDALWCCGFVYDVWISLFTLAFIEQASLPTGLRALSYTALGFFLVDIVVNFNTGYMLGDQTVMNRHAIARQYLQCWFWIDLLASLPLDDILESTEGGAFSALRAAKAPKAARILKVLKLLRIIKVLWAMRRRPGLAGVTQRLQLKKAAPGWERLRRKVETPLKWTAKLMQAFTFLLILSHLHGCAWAALQPEWELTDDMGVALRRYFEALSWAWVAVTSGSFGPASAGGLWFLHMVISTERLVIGGFAAMWGVVRALTLKEEDAGVESMRENALRYLEKHNVSIETQSHVIFSVNETRSKVKELHSFTRMLTTHSLPSELTRRIRQEMWGEHLKSLGLISQIGEWCDMFIGELAQLVSEDIFPSRVVVCVEGDAASSAFCVLTGELGIMSSTAPRNTIQPFGPGMWVGERTLVNSMLKRSATVFTRAQSTLMSVPAQGFRDLLIQCDLSARFETFCKTNLWKGLCGRCGTLGYHFADECPLLDTSVVSAVGESGSPKSISREIRLFLHAHGLEHMQPLVARLGIQSLTDLEAIGMGRLREEARLEGIAISGEQAEMFSSAAIKDFYDQMASNMLTMMRHHYIFLSHYKLEAGTEASLMRAELEQLLQVDESRPAEGVENPVFVDSEDLENLEDLQNHVRHSRNLVLLLTKDVLTRPWVLVELATAAREKLPVHLVKVSKTGNEFEYPDDMYYRALEAGTFFDELGLQLLRRAGFTLKGVAGTVRQVFNRIAVPYSPHGRASIRKAELQALLALCRRADRW